MMQKTQDPSTQNRTRWLIAAGVSAVGIMGLFGIWYVIGGVNAFEPRAVGDLLAASPELHPAEATDELCDDLACVEGWRSDVGSFLRFYSSGEAEYWATVLGDDGRRFDMVVLDMRGTDLTFEQRRLAIDTLFTRRDWS